jgi:hypothetical protein
MAGIAASPRTIAAVVTALAAGGLAGGCSEAAPGAAVPAPEEGITAADLRPSPQRADGDRGTVYSDGCLVNQESTATKRCVYAKRRAGTRILLFGDSEAMQFFPPLLRLARQRGWKLMTRLRAGCTPAAVNFGPRCNKWRERTVRLITRRDRPGLVVVTFGVAYTAVRNGRRLSSRASAPWLRRGYARTLRRLRRSGARVAVIKDTPRSPREIPDCVMANSGDPARCDFSANQPTNRAFDRKAARRVRGAKLIDPTPEVCPGGTCQVVAGDVLVYRDDVHFTATFMRTLAPWLGERLPRPAR